MNRAADGKFISTKSNENSPTSLTINLPKLSDLFTILLLLIVLLPWIYIIYRNEFLHKMFGFMENLITGSFNSVIKDNMNVTNGGNVGKTESYWK